MSLSLHAQVFRSGNDLVIDGIEYSMIGDLRVYYTTSRATGSPDVRYPEIARGNWNNIQDYAVAFVKDALYNQHEIDGLNGSISLAPRNSRQAWIDNPNIRATSYASCAPGFNVRYVEEDWNSNATIDKIITVWHELGHALLKRNHKCILEEGFTIMRGTPATGVNNQGWIMRQCPSGVPPESRGWLEMERIFWNEPQYLPCPSSSKSTRNKTKLKIHN